jgi:hypothetical protein
LTHEKLALHLLEVPNRPALRGKASTGVEKKLRGRGGG